MSRITMVLLALAMLWTTTGCSSGPGGKCGEYAKVAHGVTPCRRGYCAHDTVDEDGTNICVLYRDIGEHCTESMQCRGEEGDIEAFCDEGTCRASRELGESCTPADRRLAWPVDPCRDPLWCSPELLECVPPGRQGEVCGNCEEGLWCHDRVCKKDVSGPTCEPYTRCSDRKICFIQPGGSEGLCLEYGRGKDHLDCGNGPPCEPENQCVDDVCVPLEAEDGEPCEIGRARACLAPLSCRFTRDVKLPLDDAQFYDPEYAQGTCQSAAVGDPCDSDHTIECGVHPSKLACQRNHTCQKYPYYDPSYF